MVEKPNPGGSLYVPYPPEGVRDGERLSYSPTIGLPAPDKPEFTMNGEERCAIVLVLDYSSSMQGRSVQMLEEAVQRFRTELNEDTSVARKVDVGIVYFNNQAWTQPFENAINWTPQNQRPSGGTIISFPIQVALDMIAQRKDEYRMNGISYHRPWIVLITDGVPSHDNDEWLAEARARIIEAEDRKQVTLFPIVCGDNAQKTKEVIREKIASPNRPPKITNEANFRELFQWLSRSMASISRSSPGDRIQLEDTSGWEII